MERRSLDRIRRRIRLRDLETLISVVQSGRMRRAAEQLNLSQPAISKAIRELEDAIGVPLFERSRSGVRATPYAMALVGRAKTMFDELQLGLQDMMHMADPRGGIVRFGSMETLCAGLVGAAIERVSRHYPQMVFRVQSGESSDLVGRYLGQRDGEFIVARASHLPLPLDMIGEPLFYDRVRVVVGATNPFARRRRITLEELAGQDWILGPTEAQATSPLSEGFAAHGIPVPRIRMVTASLNIRYSLLETGHFVTVMPHSMLHFAKRRADLRMLPIEFPPWQTPTMMITLRDRTVGPAANIVMDAIRTLARQIH